MNVTAKKGGKAATRPAAKLNRRKYVELLAQAVPTVITSEQEYDRIVAIVDRLAVKRDPSVEEERLLELLSTLVEIYENEQYPIPNAPPHVMIQQFMLDTGFVKPTWCRCSAHGALFLRSSTASESQANCR